MDSHRLSTPIDTGRSGDVCLDRPGWPRPNDLAIEEKWLQLAQIDIEGFEFFYKKYRAKLHRYILASVSDRDLADDLVDETFFKAVMKLSSFTWQGHPIGSWLFSISRKVVGQEFRRRKARPEIPFDPDIHDRGDGHLLDLEMERSDEYQFLRMSLDRLDEVPRQVFVNYYWLGMTTKTIALEMGMGESTVKSHLLRGAEETAEVA